MRNSCVSFAAMKTILVVLISCSYSFSAAFAQQVLPLYNNAIPNALPCGATETSATSGGILRVSNVTVPSLTVYLPQQQQHSAPAVIICPGGGYRILAIDHEGYQVAERLRKAGIAAFVLKYRLPNDSCMSNRSVAPLQDLQQAILLVRSRAKEWGINPDKVGVMGFSAGGHLAATSATHFTQPVLNNNLGISARPDFQMLIYPVISMQENYMHAGSKANLLGNNPTIEASQFFSNEQHVNEHTPPMFLVHAADDGAVPAENSTAYAKAAMQHQVPVEMHIYPQGGHGFGLNNKTTKADWLEAGIIWLQAIGMLGTDR